MATARTARWWMLVYTIAIGLLMILVMVHGSHKVAQHNPITHYEEALTVAHRLVDKDPDSPQTRILLGTLQLSLGRLHEAEASFTRAYELLPAESIANMLNAVRKRIDETGPTPTPTTSP